MTLEELKQYMDADIPAPTAQNPQVLTTKRDHMVMIDVADFGLMQVSSIVISTRSTPVIMLSDPINESVEADTDEPIEELPLTVWKKVAE